MTFTSSQTYSDIIDKLSTLILSDKSFDEASSIMGENKDDINILKESFENAINVFLDNNILSQKEEERVVEFMD